MSRSASSAEIISSYFGMRSRYTIMLERCDVVNRLIHESTRGWLIIARSFAADTAPKGADGRTATDATTGVAIDVALATAFDVIDATVAPGPSWRAMPIADNTAIVASVSVSILRFPRRRSARGKLVRESRMRMGSSKCDAPRRCGV